MATVESDVVTSIGEAAGKVWGVLSESGSMSFAKLTREIGEPRDLAMQAVGWLAREGKVAITEGSRGLLVGLAEEE